jgi:hypothetical protein
MTPEREKEILAMEWALDPPDDSPLRKNGYCTSKLDGIPFQVVIPGNGLWNRTKVEGATYIEARNSAREKLMELELEHRSGIKLKPDQRREATKLKSKLAAKGFDSDEDFEAALAFGFRALVAQKRLEKELDGNPSYALSNVRPADLC